MNASIRTVLACAVVLLAACNNAAEPETETGFAGLGQQAGDFRQVVRGHPLQFPRDHGAHDGYRIEWWYVTANLKDEQGRDWGAQWTLFRSALRPGEETTGWDSPNLWMGHAALTGPVGHQHAETFGRGGVGQAGVQAQPFHAWIDDWSLRSADGEGLQRLSMNASGSGFGYRLELTSQMPLVRHGDDGYSEKSGQGQASYYYSQPFYQVQGEVERNGERLQVTGQAWLDREWSSQPLAASQEGWDWFSLHLADGAKLMLFQVRQTDGEPYRAGTWVTPEGQPHALQGQEIQLEAQAVTRLENGRRVPTRWQVKIPSHGVDVQVQATEPSAWMSTTFPYWEGPVQLSGAPGGRGYLEMTGY